MKTSGATTVDEGSGPAPSLWAMLRRPSVVQGYEMIATNAFTGRGLYLNLGYWEQAQTIDDACEALVTLVGETAGLGPGDQLVDVGFGFGDQDLLWAERFRPSRIVGLNITPSQVRLARQRAQRRGLAETVEFLQGSATAMPLPDASCDVVTALECAFHFDTRERFFAEAFRVLRPGGRLVLADVLPAAPAATRLGRLNQRLVWNATATLLVIPEANADSPDHYTEKLQAAGFGAVTLRSISDQVFPGWQRAVSHDRDLQRRLGAFGQLPLAAFRLLNYGPLYHAFDYVLATARKPA